MVALSDCAIRVLSASHACNVQPLAMAVTVEEVRKLSPSLIGLVIKMAQGASLPFLPGQYVNMGVPGSPQTRPYSFSSLPKDGLVEFFIRNLPGGAMSRYLFDRAKPGDTLSISGPYGTFYQRDITRPQLFLAGGTGLAPFLSMLEKIRHRPEAPNPAYLRRHRRRRPRQGREARGVAAKILLSFTTASPP
jgi:benzoate/toluate 1,2-dioxygenase reductase subunit